MTAPEDDLPPLPEPAMEDVPYELWGQNAIHSALFTEAQMHAYLRQDRKRRQEAPSDPIGEVVRYRHLRSTDDVESVMIEKTIYGEEFRTGVELDVAVDAAIAAHQPKTTT